MFYSFTITTSNRETITGRGYATQGRAMRKAAAVAATLTAAAYRVEIEHVFNYYSRPYMETTGRMVTGRVTVMHWRYPFRYTRRDDVDMLCRFYAALEAIEDEHETQTSPAYHAAVQQAFSAARAAAFALPTLPEIVGIIRAIDDVSDLYAPSLRKGALK